MSDTIFAYRKLMGTSRSNNSKTKAGRQKQISDLESALKNESMKEKCRKNGRN